MRFKLMGLLMALSLLPACSRSPIPMMYPSALQSGSHPSQALKAQRLQGFSSARSDFQIQSQTRLLQDEGLKAQQVLPDRLIFQGSPDFQPGEILVGTDLNHQGFIRRVIQVTSQGPLTQVYTEKAGLTDAFQSLNASGAQPIQAMKPIHLDKRSYRIGFVNVTSSLTAKPNFDDVSLRLESGQALFVRLAPELKLTWDVDTKASFSIMDMAPSLQMKPIGHVNFKNFTIPTQIGPVPVTFYIRPGASMDWGHQASGSVALGAQLTGTVKTGIELKARSWSQSPDVNTFFDYGYGGKLKDPRLDFNGKLQTRVHIPRVRVESNIAEMPGPYIEAESYLDGELNASIHVNGQKKTVTGNAKAYLGVALKAGLPKTELFGKTWTQEIHKTLYNKRVKTLYDKTIRYDLP